jgi:hypothetical protein
LADSKRGPARIAAGRGGAGGLQGRFQLLVRSKGRVEREKYPTLDEALDALEARGRELQRTARAQPVDTKVLGRYEPAQQVSARLELRGRGGVDIRGDGSVSAFTGRVRRLPVQERGTESAYEALRRVLSAS